MLKQKKLISCRSIVVKSFDSPDLSHQLVVSRTCLVSVWEGLLSAGYIINKNWAGPPGGREGLIWLAWLA